MKGSAAGKQPIDEYTGRFLEQTLTWLKNTLEKTPAENRRFYIETTKHWSLRVRMPFLFTLFLSDLWILPFSRLYGTQMIWLIGEALLGGDMPALIELIVPAGTLIGLNGGDLYHNP